MGEALALGAAAAALAFQLFVPPRVGLGDNGDFNRTMGGFGLSAPASPQRYFGHFIPHFDYDPAPHEAVRFISSEKLFVALAVGIHRLTGGGPTFDIAPLAALHALALLAALGLLMAAARGLAPAARWTVVALLALAFTDVGYAAYLNSFYSEPASLAFFLAAVALLALIASGRARLSLLAALAAALVLFVAAKPQNFAAGLPLALLAGRQALLRSDWRWRAAVAATVAATVAMAAVMFTRGYPAAIREQGLQLSVFFGILRDAPDPRQDLAELGLPPKLAAFAGMHPWSAGAPAPGDPNFRRLFFDRITTARVLGFYARHPGRLWRVTDAVAQHAFRARPVLGNYEASTGRPPFSQSRSFSWWGRLRERVLPRSLGGVLAVFALLLLGSAAVYARAAPSGRRLVELYWAVALVALLQLPVIAVAMAAIDPAKHTFLFKAAADLCVIAAAGWAAATVRGRAARPLSSGGEERPRSA